VGALSCFEKQTAVTTAAARSRGVERGGAVAHPGLSYAARVKEPDATEGAEPEAGTPEQSEAEQERDLVVPPRRRRSRGWGWVLLLAVFASLAIAAIELVARFPELVRERVLREAEARGLALEAKAIEPVGLLPWQKGPGRVVLREVVLGVAKVDDVELRIQRVEVDVEKLEPVRVRVTGVSLRAAHPAALFALEREALAGRLAELPVEVSELRIRIQQLVDSLPVAALAEIDQLSIEAGKADLEGKSIRLELPIVPGVKLGPYHVLLDRKDERLGVVARELPGVRIETDETLARVELSLERSDRRRLVQLVPGLRLPELSVEAKVMLELTGPSVPKGRVEATLHGWTPPRPKELGGIVYGDQTRLRATFARDGLLSLRLDDVDVRVGSLRLGGQGRLDAARGGRLSLELAGSIDCRQLASSAIGAHLGLSAGAFAAQLTRGRLGGTVAVSLSVDAPLSSPTEAIISPNATLRCKLLL
jgi:hypothetical protein